MNIKQKKEKRKIYLELGQMLITHQLLNKIGIHGGKLKNSLNQKQPKMYKNNCTKN